MWHLGEAIFDSVMELNYEAQRAIRLEEAQAKENEKIDVELTQPKKGGSIADQLGYSSEEPVEGRVDDELWGKRAWHEVIICLSLFKWNYSFWFEYHHKGQQMLFKLY